MTAVEPTLVDGEVEPALAAELPGLRVRWTVVEGAPSRTPRGVRERLAALSSRLRGPEAIALRQRPIPHAYRVFFRHLGLDPDVERTPAEAVVVERLLAGGLGTGRAVEDAVALAIAETGVAVCALDEDAVAGALVVRAARPGEALDHDRHADDLAPGVLVLADERGPVGVLLGRLSDCHAAGRRTALVRLVATAVPGVPDAHVDEALWLAASALQA
ncbi:MAG TPA: hypothetical protein VFT50_04555 [Baekduia sp.]|nr:hypothetical protein [Baekduia sp.]